MEFTPRLLGPSMFQRLFAVLVAFQKTMASQKDLSLQYVFILCWVDEASSQRTNIVRKKDKITIG